MFNTDEEVELFIPYITYINAGDQGGYEHSNSMLMITKTSAYRVCAVRNGDDCVDACSSDQKVQLISMGISVLVKIKIAIVENTV